MTRPPLIPDITAGYCPRPNLETHVADHLRRVIARHTGIARLPAERIIAEQLAVSRPVVRAALAQLESEGRIARRRRAGTALRATPGAAA